MPLAFSTYLWLKWLGNLRMVQWHYQRTIAFESVLLSQWHTGAPLETLPRLGCFICKLILSWGRRYYDFTHMSWTSLKWFQGPLLLIETGCFWTDWCWLVLHWNVDKSDAILWPLPCTVRIIDSDGASHLMSLLHGSIFPKGLWCWDSTFGNFKSSCDRSNYSTINVNLILSCANCCTVWSWERILALLSVPAVGSACNVHVRMAWCAHTIYDTCTDILHVIQLQTTCIIYTYAQTWYAFGHSFART
jgi:hypothetical protein